MTVASVDTNPYTFTDAFGVGRSDEAQKLRDVQRKALLDAQRGRALPPHLTILSPTARIEVDTRWGSDLCEALFEFLARRFPADLLQLVRGNVLTPPALTFAAEIAGGTSNDAAVRDALIPLLRHESALVREGAIYGLRNDVHLTVKDTLKDLAERDPSLGVRQAASDVLDEQ